MRKILLLMVLGLGVLGLTASKAEAAPPGVFYRPPSYDFAGVSPSIRYNYAYNPGFVSYRPTPFGYRYNYVGPSFSYTTRTPTFFYTYNTTPGFATYNYSPVFGYSNWMQNGTYNYFFGR